MVTERRGATQGLKNQGLGAILAIKVSGVIESTLAEGKAAKYY
jgi:hypothetical protein